MNQTPVELASCESEPIHIVNAIQPIGFLLALSADWIVVRASENVADYLGVGYSDLLGKAVSGYLPAQVLHDIRGRLQLAASIGIVERLFGERLSPDGSLFDIAVHLSGDEFVLEFEETPAEIGQPLGVLQFMVAKLQRQNSMQRLYRELASQVRALTNFDRVMVYRFNDDGAGVVVGESSKSGLPPFLGLHFPASDIPVQARALYERNFLRIIVDVDAAPVSIAPTLSPETGPLDLSMSILRAVSPIHLEYLRNMGVRSSMSISLMQGGRLWGLIACHHPEPKHVSLQLRSTAELFGQMVSYILEARQRDDDSRHDVRSKEVHSLIAATFAEVTTDLKAVPEILTSVPDYIPFDGIGIYYAGEATLMGVTPSLFEFLQLGLFLNSKTVGQVYSTHCLSSEFAPAAAYFEGTAGLLSVPLSRNPRDHLVFFRREAIGTVTWAGEPTKIETSEGRLSPRKSFAAWRETVHQQSERWTAREVRTAETLRVILMELVLRASETAQADRVVAQQHQEILIAELNHRVRNILGLVRGLVNQSAAAATDIRPFVEDLDHRIASLARAHDLLTSSNWGATSFRALLRAETDADSLLDGRLTLTGPEVLLEPKAFTPMALVLHEVVTNARKYGALSTIDGHIVVAVSEDQDGNVTVTWTESGGPIVTPPTRRGFGSTILEQAIAFELNGTSTPRYRSEGFSVELLLPAKFARCVRSTPEPLSAAVARPTPDQPALTSLLKTCLLVEDNLFIAIDAEVMLLELGASTVVVARSVSEALLALKANNVTFALLDVNLGAENSLPIARALQFAETPFAFGTGYGDALVMAETLKAVPIVTKPYSRVALLKILYGFAAPEPEIQAPLGRQG